MKIYFLKGFQFGGINAYNKYLNVITHLAGIPRILIIPAVLSLLQVLSSQR